MSNIELQLLLVASINNTLLKKLLEHVAAGTAVIPEDVLRSVHIVMDTYRDLRLTNAPPIQKDESEDDQQTDARCGP